MDFLLFHFFKFFLIFFFFFMIVTRPVIRFHYFPLNVFQYLCLSVQAPALTELLLSNSKLLSNRPLAQARYD